MSDLRPCDRAILLELADGPLTVEEIAKRIRNLYRRAWAAEHGYDIEWETEREPLGARGLASAAARAAGVLLLGFELQPRLRYLEQHEFVARIQIDGHRPMLWRIR